ncbi:TonB-dependent receptor [Silanimonas sp.]|uniref:TonB-dependent receptor n=1 Tax=Silanimonas sp. TaxID=1929290 RepID=UPI0037CB69EB
MHHTPRTPNRRALAAAIALLLAAPFAAAQAPAASPGPDDEAPTPQSLDAIIVTGTPAAQTKLESSVSISTIGVEQIEQSAPRSTAEIFRNIPGVRSESTGGEGNANIAVRGLPVAAGGAKFLQLQEDGLPVLEFGDIAFGNADIFLRADWSLDRIEALRGGSASTFASNSPGGIINFVSNTGEVQGGAIGLTAGLDYDSFRTDFRYGGPINDQWRFHVAGFYRRGDGVRDPGYTAEEGGQIKANLTREHDGGFLRFHLKLLDDRAIGYLPMPVRVTGTNRNPRFSGFPGFDPGRDTPHSPNFLTDIGLDGNNQRRRTDIADGMRPKSTAFGLEFQHAFDNGWTLDNRFRYADTDGRFVSPFPAEVDDGADIAASIGGAGSRLVAAGSAVTSTPYTGLAVREHLFNTEINDFGNYANNLQLSKAFDTAGGTLDLAGGWYRSRQNIDMDWVWNSYVLALDGNDARLLDVISATGQRLSTNGLYAYGVPFWGNCCTRSYNTKYVIDAPYLSLAWSNDRLSVDASVRRDNGEATGNYAGSVQVANLDVNGNGTIEPNERSVSTVNNAAVSPVDYDWGYTSWSVGMNWLASDDLAYFARASRGGRANADRLLFGVVRADGSVRSEDAVDLVDQVEAGVKWRWDGLDLYLTAFRAETEEQNFEATNQRFLNRTYLAKGIEIEGAWRMGAFSVNGGATWTDAEISRDQISPANVGNTPRRQADWVYQVTPAYTFERWTLGMNVIGTTDSYAQDNNALVMPGFVQTNLFADWRVTDALTLTLNVNNVFDEFGITESEEGAIVDNAANIIRARSIPGRSTALSLRYDF